ncbi:MAG: LysM peptidoglycan-binding domain-containing protein [Terriglobales bacterium]
MQTSNFWALTALAAAMTLTSCKTEEAKPVSVAPPPKAQAPTISQTTAAPAPAQTTPAPAHKADPVEALIARVEREYQTGRANYAAGHLDAAKDNFDRAFDMLVGSGQDIRNDERLQAAFDKLVENVNGLEMIAIQQGDGFTQQKPEPAPIDEANEVTFPVDPNIKARAEVEMRGIKSDLPLVLNDEVAQYISYYSTRGHDTLERALQRSGRYRDMIRRVLAEEGVPQDLIYLAEAESGFHPLALSRVGARGMWQFMASRASGYGLTRNWLVDDRQDPEKATRAAARHLKDLYNQFGDWYLAMAAYNSGPGTVQKAVERTGYADFWELYRRGVLPKETRNYVPIILAVTIMAKNPQQYGLRDLQLDPPLKTDVVKVDYPVDLRLVAECVDSTVATLQELNPSLLRMTTPKDGTYDLKLPVGTTEKYQQAIAAIPVDMRVAWRYHKVEAGETLAEIAHKYHASASAIAEVNNVKADDELLADSKLIIPATPGRRTGEGSGTYAKRPTYYRIRKGDTVLTVADDFGVPAAKIRQWNRLRGNRLVAGHRLKIYKPAGADEPVEAAEKGRLSSSRKPITNNHLAANSKRVVHHHVVEGETLSSIARRYDTTVTALRRANPDVNAAHLVPGIVLVVRTE